MWKNQLSRLPDGTVLLQRAFGVAGFNLLSTPVPINVAITAASNGSRYTWRIGLTLGDLGAGSHNLNWSYTPLQSFRDEAWGLDNVQIDGTPVPAPATLFLSAPGLLGVSRLRTARS